MNHQIMFSQVREDPMIEITAVNSIKSNTIRGVLIGSGGCTLLSLLTLNSPLELEIVDANPAQIYLIQLKLTVIVYLGELNQILDFFQGDLSIEKYDQITKELFRGTEFNYLSPEAIRYWQQNMNFIYAGCNQQGIFEQLFVDLIKSNFDFKSNFNRQSLIDKFGSNGVTNSINREFYDHFSEVMKKYQKLYQPTQNYFYYQILSNRYHLNDLPHYLTYLSDFLANFKKHTIRFHTRNLSKYLIGTEHQGAETKQKRQLCDRDYNYYDFVQISNLTDWLDVKQRTELIDLTYKALKPNGMIIARRLNGDYILNDLLKEQFVLINHIDRSHFYSEVISGIKKY